MQIKSGVRSVSRLALFDIKLEAGWANIVQNWKLLKPPDRNLTFRLNKEGRGLYQVGDSSSASWQTKAETNIFRFFPSHIIAEELNINNPIVHHLSVEAQRSACLSGQSVSCNNFWNLKISPDISYFTFLPAADSNIFSSNFTDIVTSNF